MMLSMANSNANQMAQDIARRKQGIKKAKSLNNGSYHSGDGGSTTEGGLSTRSSSHAAAPRRSSKIRVSKKTRTSMSASWHPRSSTTSTRNSKSGDALAVSSTHSVDTTDTDMTGASMYLEDDSTSPAAARNRDFAAAAMEASQLSMAHHGAEAASAESDSGLDFGVCQSVYMSWDMIRSIPDWQDELGAKVLSEMVQREPKSRASLDLGNGGELLLDAFDPQVTAQSQVVVGMIDELVMVLGPDVELLQEAGMKFKLQGFDMSLFPVLLQSIPVALQDLLAGDWSEEVASHWGLFLTCAEQQIMG